MTLFLAGQYPARASFHAMPCHPIPSPGGKHKSLFLLGFGGGLGDFNIGEVFLADSTEGVEV